MWLHVTRSRVCVCAMHPAATDADGHLRFRGFLRLCQLLGPEELVSNLKKLAIGESRHALALCVCVPTTNELCA